jgi:hypothetical protein
LTFTEIGDPVPINSDGKQSGFSVEILKVNSKNAANALGDSSRREFEEKFASYWTSYRTFRVPIGGQELKFETLIKNTEQTEKLIKIGDLDYRFIVKIIEWTFENKKKTYLCNAKGIPYQES